MVVGSVQVKDRLQMEKYLDNLTYTRDRAILSKQSDTFLRPSDTSKDHMTPFKTI